jgi:calmodulin
MSRSQPNKQQYVTISKKLDIPEDKVAEYKESFDMFDRNKKGKITINDITKIMKNFGYPLSKDEAKKMVSSVDSSGDGEVDFEEFVMLMEKHIHNISDDPVLQAFRDFDKNDDGKITNHEFRYILTHVGDNKFSDKDVDELFKECEIKDEGELEYENFIMFWRKQMDNYKI